MAEEHKEIDVLTGTATTGHEWDGIRELNNPLPRWWIITLVAVAVLHHDRLGGRLLDRLSSLAAIDQLDAGRVRLPHPDGAP